MGQMIVHGADSAPSTPWTLQTEKAGAAESAQLARALLFLGAVDNKSPGQERGTAR